MSDSTVPNQVDQHSYRSGLVLYFRHCTSFGALLNKALTRIIAGKVIEVVKERRS